MQFSQIFSDLFLNKGIPKLSKKGFKITNKLLTKQKA